MTWEEYIEQQDYIGKRCEQFIVLAQTKIVPEGMSKGARQDYKTHQAIMLGYRLAIAEVQDNINKINSL